jgi:UDP-glucose 4-epimerase
VTERVVVTGGAGFIGSHLVAELLGRGVSVMVVDDFSTGTVGNLAEMIDSIDLVEGDIMDVSLAPLFADAHSVFHLAVRNVRASIGDPEENFRVNATGTLRILEAMRKGRRGRFLYVSSSEVYGDAGVTDFSESTVPAPTTVYGAGKLAGEHVTLAYHTTYGMDTRVVRPFNNFGPRSHFEGDSGEVIPKFILRSLAGIPLLVHGSGEQTRDFMFVRDTAYWLAELADVPELVGEIFNIGTGIDRSVKELATQIIELTGSESEVVYTDERPGDLPRLRADTTKIASIVDFHLPTSFEDGLTEAVAYFSAQDVPSLLETEQEHNW